MNLIQRLFRRPAPPAPAPVRAVSRAAAAVGAGISGRPTYAGLWGANALIPREVTFELLTQFRGRVPVIKRTTEILSGFVGVPCLKCENDADTEYLEQWACTIEYGDGVGRGLAVWLDDLIDQSLTFGYAVGEGEIAAPRNGIVRLWTYLSPSIAFRASETGAIQTVQWQGRGMETPLNADTIARLTHDPKGCNPNGESLLLSLPAFCQALIDIHHAHQSTWRRNGIPVYHVHTELPADFNDPDGAVANEIRDANIAGWNEVMRSQAVDGLAKDFFTVSVGKTVVSVIGADGAVMDIEVSNRVLTEQIISATGIPPFMFGLQWSTTERLSQQQADALLATVDNLRREAESAIRKVVDLHLRLTGKRAGLEYELCWPEVTLQDRLASSQAANADAQASLARLKFATECWRMGIFDQEDVAEYTTGDPEVAVEMQEPPSALPEAPAPPADNAGDTPPPARAWDVPAEKVWAEAFGEYPEFWKAAACCGNGH